MAVKHHKTEVFFDGHGLDLHVQGLILTQAERDYFLAWHLGVKN